MTLTFLAVAVVYVLAVMRVTRLINSDAILDPMRVKLVRRFGPKSFVVYFVMCPWCVGFWVCLGTAWIPMWFAHAAVAQYVGYALAASHLIGLFSPLASNDDSDVEVVEVD